MCSETILILAAAVVNCCLSNFDEEKVHDGEVSSCLNFMDKVCQLHMGKDTHHL